MSCYMATNSPHVSIPRQIPDGTTTTNTLVNVGHLGVSCQKSTRAAKTIPFANARTKVLLTSPRELKPTTSITGQPRSTPGHSNKYDTSQKSRTKPTGLKNWLVTSYVTTMSAPTQKARPVDLKTWPYNTDVQLHERGWRGSCASKRHDRCPVSAAMFCYMTSTDLIRMLHFKIPPLCWHLVIY